MSCRTFNTKAEAERRLMELRALLILTLPTNELTGFMTSRKPPSVSDLVRLAKQRAAQKVGTCALCGQSLPSEPPDLDGNLEKKPASTKPFTGPARAREGN
jgi:hypothetical protein